MEVEAVEVEAVEARSYERTKLRWQGGGSGSAASPQTAHGGGASLLSGMLNMTNTILGAGMLGLPKAFAKCGLATGVVFLFLFAALSALGLHLLSAAADLAGRPATFHSVAEKALPGSGLLIDGAVAIKCFGVGTAYLIIVGDSIPKALLPLGASGAMLDRRLWTALAALLVSPLVYQRQIDALRHTSLVALVCVVLITLMVLLFELQPTDGFDPCAGATGAPGNATLESACRGPVRAATGALETLRALPFFVFAYTCHQNIISVTNEMGRPTPRRVSALITAAEGAALLQYLLIACAAYETFGESVPGDVLTAYPPSALTSVARLMIAAVVTFSYPLQSHPSRACVLSILAAVDARRRHRVVSAVLERNRPAPASPVAPAIAVAPDASDAPVGPDAAPAAPAAPDALPAHAAGWSRSCVVSTAFLLLSTAVALAVDDLGFVLSMVGATGSTTVSYLLPGLCYYRLCPEPRSPLRRAALLQLCIGCAILPLSLGLILAKLGSE